MAELVHAAYVTAVAESDHLPLLEELAASSKVVAELTECPRQSTWALLHGLARSRVGGAGMLLSIDVGSGNAPRPWLTPVAAAVDVVYAGAAGGVIGLPCSVDLLVLDTTRELEAHHRNARRWIVIMRGTAPDTEPAIVDFLCGHPEWDVLAVRRSRGGMTVLTRAHEQTGAGGRSRTPG